MSTFNDSNAGVLSTKIISIISSLSAAFIIIYHSILRYQKTTKNEIENINSILNRISVIVLYVILISSFTFSITLCLHMFEIITPFGPISISCFALYVINVFQWSLNKTFVYYSYFLRLQTSYNNSMFELNKYVAIILYLSATIYFSAYILNIILRTNPNGFKWSNKYNYCHNTAQLEGTMGYIIVFGIVIYEFVITILTLFLFIKPLCQLKKIKNDLILHNTIIKIGLLNSIMIISSILFFMIFSGTVGGIFLLIDNFINSLCMILMVNVHQRLYYKLCGICINNCKCCQYDTNNMAFQIQKSTSVGDVNSANSPVTSITETEMQII